MLPFSLLLSLKKLNGGCANFYIFIKSGIMYNYILKTAPKYKIQDAKLNTC